jgi:hypothetical protein
LIAWKKKLKKIKTNHCPLQGLMPVILAIQDVEIRRIVVHGHPRGKKRSWDPISANKSRVCWQVPVIQAMHEV